MARPRRSWVAIAETTVAWSFVVLAILYVSIGVTWTWQNLWDQPPYADTMRYRWFSETLTVDRFHAGLYPLILSLVNPWGENLGRIQFLQFGVLALSSAYFVFALRGADFARHRYGRRGVVGAFGALLLLVLFDPLLAHFVLSLMPDSLALSGCLVFSAALSELRRDGARSWFAAPLLFGGFVLAAGVRIEKSSVLLLTVLATLLLWTLVARRFASGFDSRPRTRGVLVLAIALLGFASVQWLQTSMYREPPPRIAQGLRLSPWSMLTTVLHHRIIFPNLASVYEELSPASRALLTREDARTYDRKIHNTWAVTDRVTRADPKIRDRLTRDLASTAFRNRWPSIALDVATDTAENLLAPVSFYLRLVAWSLEGADPGAWVERFEATPWTYEALARNHPRMSRLYVAVSGSLFLFACFLALLHARRSFRAGVWKPGPQTVFSLVPVVLLCTANAFAFSLSADLVHVRYTLFAHSAGVLLVYRGALAWVLREEPEEQAGSGPGSELRIGD